jgi:hypothetical protein
MYGLTRSSVIFCRLSINYENYLFFKIEDSLRLSITKKKKKHNWLTQYIFRHSIVDYAIIRSYMELLKWWHSLPKYIEFFVRKFFLWNHLVVTPSGVISTCFT